MANVNSSMDTLLNVLQQTRAMFMLEVAHLPEAEQHRLWSLRAGELASALVDTAPSSKVPIVSREIQNPTAELQHGSAQQLPKIQMNRQRSEQPQSFLLDRNKNASQHSEPMSRKRSGNATTPFTSNGSNVPPLTINAYQSSCEEPFSSFTIGSPSKKPRTSSMSSGRPLSILPEMTVYDPAEYCNQVDPELWQRPSTLSAYPKQRSRRNSNRLNLSRSQPSVYAWSSPLSESPATSVSGQSTNATTFTSGMSRQSSVGSSVYDGLEMMNIHSQASNVSSVGTGGDLSSFTDDHLLSQGNKFSAFLSENSCSQSPFLTRGDVSHAPRMSQSFPSSTLNPVESTSLAQSAVVEEDVSMKRSDSTETNASSSSQTSRRSQKHLQRGSRKLAPKLSEDEESMSRQSSSSGHQPIRIKSTDGSSKEVMMISKTPYVRPPNNKVQCNRCNEQPEGFRGVHELQRHTERAHSIVRKAFICVDISHDKKFLANCKACRMGKKYGAYYNAAAHLRRTHFNPRKGRKGKAAKPEEKRGGKGGGDQPTMEILKMWMEEIEEFVPENMPPLDDESNEVGIEQIFGETTTSPPRQSYASSSISEPFSQFGRTPDNAVHAAIPLPVGTSSLSERPQIYADTSANVASQAPAILDLDTVDFSYDVSMNDAGFEPFPFEMSPFEDAPFGGFNHF